MKSICRLVPGVLALSLSFCLAAQPVGETPPIKTSAVVGALAEFNKLPALHKSRACGHLLVGMAIAGQREYVRAGAKKDAVSPQALAVSLAGVLHLVESGELTEDEKAAAELVAQKIAGGEAKDHIDQTHKCATQVSEQVSSKKYLAEQLEPAMEIAQQQLRLVGDSEFQKMEAEKAQKSSK